MNKSKLALVAVLVLVPSSFAQLSSVLLKASCAISTSHTENKRCAKESVTELQTMLRKMAFLPIMDGQARDAVVKLYLKNIEPTFLFDYNKTIDGNTLTMTIYDDYNKAVYSASRPIILYLNKKDVEMLAAGKGEAATAGEK